MSCDANGCCQQNFLGKIPIEYFDFDGKYGLSLEVDVISKVGQNIGDTEKLAIYSAIGKNIIDIVTDQPAYMDEDLLISQVAKGTYIATIDKEVIYTGFIEDKININVMNANNKFFDGSLEIPGFKYVRCCQ